MKKLSLALVVVFALVLACGGGATPDQVIKKILDGVQNGDGNAVVSCMSSTAIQDVEESLVQMKEAPEESAAFLATIGVEMTAEEVETMTAGDYLTAMLSSEVMTSELPDFSTAEIGEAVIDGETATVPVTIDGNTKNIKLILENDEWKLEESLTF